VGVPSGGQESGYPGNAVENLPTARNPYPGPGESATGAATGQAAEETAEETEEGASETEPVVAEDTEEAATAIAPTAVITP
jgi:hypothetical protein